MRLQVEEGVACISEVRDGMACDECLSVWQNYEDTLADNVDRMRNVSTCTLNTHHAVACSLSVHLQNISV